MQKQTYSVWEKFDTGLFCNAFNGAGNDAKKLWKLIRQLFGNPKCKAKIMQIGSETSDLGMASEIIYFFADISPNLAAGIPDSLLECDYTFNGEHAEFNFTPVDELQIAKLLKQISVNNLTGIDGIPIRLLKMNNDLASELICHIVNLSLSTLVVPAGWKKAVVTPLHKAGVHTDPRNYRPVSILPAVSKIIGRVVHNQVMEYFNQFQILSGSGRATPLRPVFHHF